jgi:pantetheine-phosphate adenylyltransferase
VTIAVYPGTFDPFTNGHLDIARRAARLFDKLIVAVYDLPRSKRLLFSTEERVDLVRGSVVGLDNIEVTAYTGTTTDFATKVGAVTLVRGLRMSADFEHEFEMAQMNKNLSPDLEYVCMMTRGEYQFVSSSLLKEVAALGGDINNLLPANVAVALKKKLG